MNMHSQRLLYATLKMRITWKDVTPGMINVNEISDMNQLRGGEGLTFLKKRKKKIEAKLILKKIYREREKKFKKKT